ncbi:putative RNA methyltransferase [Acinetobacter rathckeae]|uniref:putative RNA methyltransferase n=1 Tax=Acinetobacter rathckeae TaxID=2605272 RepID=UPI0018A2F14C|nr:methyltransferase domain-containing protein [Acinetobacter rathckeae]MBF7688702.1 methyltransferase domain-containing protein [Acinetobacter rathckeae]MBF7696095.1 methyltransferase domain-containing protein [Acinetobacter rathckeae]
MCPVCRHQLHLSEQTWQCEQKHSFDVAKQGYVNLHVVQHKHSKTPGDTVESVTARRAFLAEGHYAPLQQAVTEIITKHKINSVLDIGCGEGYYTSAMQPNVKQCIGVDIAKNAVQRAAKTNREVTWVVGTGAVLPVMDSSIDLCSSLFSPLPIDEMCRVLQDDGYCLVVTPAKNHLYAMREALFEQVTLHEPDKILAQFEPYFDLVKQQQLEYTINLTQDALKNLIAMTPYAYKAKLDRRCTLEQVEQFEVTASFQIYLFQRRKLHLEICPSKD